MFNRRVAASMNIPPYMYRALHINSAKQASRMLPAMVPVSTTSAMQPCSLLPLVSLGGAGVAGAVESAKAMGEMVNLISEDTIAKMLCSGTVNMQFFVDTMCCVSVFLSGPSLKH